MQLFCNDLKKISTKEIDILIEKNLLDISEKVEQNESHRFTYCEYEG